MSFIIVCTEHLHVFAHHYFQLKVTIERHLRRQRNKEASNKEVLSSLLRTLTNLCIPLSTYEFYVAAIVALLPLGSLVSDSSLNSVTYIVILLPCGYTRDLWVD